MFMVQSNTKGFPSLRSTPTTGFKEDFSSSTVPTLPTASTGDLIMVVFSSQNGSTAPSTTSTGWTTVITAQQGFIHTTTVFVGIQGTAGTLTVSHQTDHCTWSAYAIQDWNGTLANIKAFSAQANSTTNMNPPALTPSTGQHNYLWAVVGIANSSSYPTAAPSGYSNLTQSRCNATVSATHIGHAVAFLQKAGTTEDPGTFTSATTDWLALTISIY